ncbi:MAG: glycosyltransferase [Candidatus Limivicinus sp.]|nr:glycosyltransferase [Candidatus Limivicinus sp.]
MMDSVFEQYDQQLLNAAEDNLVSAFELLRSFPGEYLPHGNELILQRFSFPRIAAELAENYWSNPFYISELLDVAAGFPFQKRAIKTIGMYYTKLYNGGAERVVCLLSNLLCQAGYRVVIITDEAPDPRDYFLNDAVVRVVISGTVPTDGKNAADRFDRFARYVRDYEIDAVVYHSWQLFSAFWDMCAIKYEGAAFIAHSHNIFIAHTLCMTDVIWRSHSIYRQADAIVTLSETDGLYWSQFNDRVFTVNNPSPSKYPTAHLPR